MKSRKSERSPEASSKSKSGPRSLLTGAMEFKMMISILKIADEKKNCWSLIARQLGVSYPAIIKNTFYSRATTYLKKISCHKQIKCNSEEEQARIQFYLLSALECLNKANFHSEEKPHYFETMIIESNLNVSSLKMYAQDFGISLNSKQLEITLNQLVGKYNSYEIVHPIILPATVRIPIDEGKNLMGSFQKKKMVESYDVETKSSILFFLTFPRNQIIRCILQEPNLLIEPRLQETEKDSF
jgi:hypothetical protein